MLNALESMMGKNCSIDGVMCGVVSEIGLEQSFDAYPTLTVKLILTEQTIDNLREYSYIMGVMGEEGNSNVHRRS